MDRAGIVSSIPCCGCFSAININAEGTTWRFINLRLVGSNPARVPFSKDSEMFLQTLVMFLGTGLVNAEGTTLNLAMEPPTFLQILVTRLFLTFLKE